MMSPSTHSTCEACEMSLSALIDGELEAPEQLPAIDHLLDCARCRDFYRQARALGSMVTSATSSEPAPPEVWERIAGETGLAERDARESSTGKAQTWAHVLQLAAILVAALGLWFLWPAAVPDTPEAESSNDSGVVNVVLEQDQGTMSDERFLELTTEILRADRDYHRKMLEIMRVVSDMTPRSEGSGDESAVVARDGLRQLSRSEDAAENDSPRSGDLL